MEEEWSQKVKKNEKEIEMLKKKVQRITSEKEAVIIHKIDK
jgi:hypothetical protein